MVHLNMNCLHFLQFVFFEHLFHLYYKQISNIAVYYLLYSGFYPQITFKNRFLYVDQLNIFVILCISVNKLTCEWLKPSPDGGQEWTNENNPASRPGQ